MVRMISLKAELQQHKVFHLVVQNTGAVLQSFEISLVTLKDGFRHCYSPLTFLFIIAGEFPHILAKVALCEVFH